MPSVLHQARPPFPQTNPYATLCGDTVAQMLANPVTANDMLEMDLGGTKPAAAKAASTADKPDTTAA